MHMQHNLKINTLNFPADRAIADTCAERKRSMAPINYRKNKPVQIKKKVFELINVSSDEEEAEPRGQNAGPRGDDVEPERFEATEMQQNVGQNVSHEEEGAWGGMPRLSYVPDFSNREDT